MNETTDNEEKPENQAQQNAEPAAEPSPEERETKLQEEIAKLKDSYLRAMAETENVRNRAKRENEDTAKYAVTKFAREMVNILENLVRASESITPEARASNDIVKSVADGIDMTTKELTGIFERSGIKRIHPLGEKFDHNLHQAVAQVESADAEPGTVLSVLQAGYILHDRLLRPAMVNVAKTKAADTAA